MEVSKWETERKRLLPVSRSEIVMAKSGKDGRNGMNRAPEQLEPGPKTAAKLIVFILWVSEEMQDVC